MTYHEVARSWCSSVIYTARGEQEAK
jgi:hypothetical protein